MPWPHIVALGAVALGTVALAMRLVRPLASVRTLEAWAGSRGWRTRGNGRATPLEIVGTHAGRLFTVGYQSGPPDVLLVAIDCDVDGEGAFPENIQLSDAALVSRWMHPTTEHLDNIEHLLDAMVRLALDLEATRAPAVDEC